jgi:hypothetical protein
MVEAQAAASRDVVIPGAARFLVFRGFTDSRSPRRSPARLQGRGGTGPGSALIARFGGFARYGGRSQDRVSYFRKYGLVARPGRARPPDRDGSQEAARSVRNAPSRKARQVVSKGVRSKGRALWVAGRPGCREVVGSASEGRMSERICDRGGRSSGRKALVARPCGRKAIQTVRDRSCPVSVARSALGLSKSPKAARLRASGRYRGRVARLAGVSRGQGGP